MKKANRRHIHSNFEEEFQSLTTQVLAMGQATIEQLKLSFRYITAPGKMKLKAIVLSDDKIDKMERDIDQLATRMIALRQPMAIDLRRIVSAMKIASDLERFSDYCKSIAHRSPNRVTKSFKEHEEALVSLAQAVSRMLYDIMVAYKKKDISACIEIHSRDYHVNKGYDSLFGEMLTYMMEDPRTIAQGVQIMFIAKNLERMGDHVTNIAEEIYYQEVGRAFVKDHVKPKGRALLEDLDHDLLGTEETKKAK